MGDFDGDGVLDLAVASSGADNVSVLLGNGMGASRARKTLSPETTLMPSRGVGQDEINRLPETQDFGVTPSTMKSS